MIDWPLRALLLVGLVTVPYLAVARVTGLHRLLAFSVRRLPVGTGVALAALLVWLAGVVAVPLLGSTASGFRLYVVGVVAFGGGLLALAYAAGALPAYLAAMTRRDVGDIVEADDAGSADVTGSADGSGTVDGSGTADGSGTIDGSGTVDGPVTLRGEARALADDEVPGATGTGTGTASGPVSGADCLVCETRTQGRIRRLRAHNEFWAPRASCVDAVPFGLADDTGSLVVDPDGARIRLAENTACEDVADGGDRRLDRVRRVERRLDPGDEVLVTGTVREVDGDRVVVANGSSTSLVADPDVGAVEGLGRAVRVGGALGVVLAGGGLAAMAVAARLV